MPKAKKKEPQWGGKRPGSGRPKAEHPRVRLEAMRVSQDAADRFHSYKEAMEHPNYGRAFDALVTAALPPAVLKFPKKD